MKRAFMFIIVLLMLSGSLPAAEPPVPTLVPVPITKKRSAALLRKIDQSRLKLAPLHRKLGKPRYGEWRWVHQEPGQSFAQYLGINPVPEKGQRRTIYLQPLGALNTEQHRIFEITAEFIGIYFNTPVKILQPLPLTRIPEEAQRVHPVSRSHQILTEYIMKTLLQPRLPADAAACLAVTNRDIWPGRGRDFVFGAASLHDRVGVCSLNRNGDPTKDPAAFRRCLLRTIKTASHEMAHIYSIYHCTAFRCNMCGSMSREESDTRPVFACPECQAKFCWIGAIAPLERYRRLAAFFKKYNLEKQRGFAECSVKALSAKNISK